MSNKFRSLLNWIKNIEPIISVIGVIASTILAVFAIYITIRLSKGSQKIENFNSLLQKNADIAELLSDQVKNSNKLIQVERTVNLNKIRSTFRDAVMPMILNSKATDIFTNTERIRWLKSFEDILRSEVGNAWLYEDSHIADIWHNMILETGMEIRKLNMGSYWENNIEEDTEKARFQIWKDYLEKVYDFNEKMSDIVFKNMTHK